MSQSQKHLVTTVLLDHAIVLDQHFDRLLYWLDHGRIVSLDNNDVVMILSKSHRYQIVR